MQEYIEFVSAEWPLFLGLVIIVVLLVRAFISGVKSVAPMEAVGLMNHENAVIVDVRSDKEYADGHIANSLNIPQGLLSDRLAELADFKETPIIVACKSGSRSGMASSVLIKQGFQNVRNLGGGILAWSNANLPLSKGGAKQKKNNDKKKGKETKEG